VALQPLQQRRPAGRVVVDAKALARLQNGNVQPSLGDIDTHHQTVFDHLSSLPCGTGACPLQLFGFKKKAVGPQLIHGLGS